MRHGRWTTGWDGSPKATSESYSRRLESASGIRNARSPSAGWWRLRCAPHVQGHKLPSQLSARYIDGGVSPLHSVLFPIEGEGPVGQASHNADALIDIHPHAGGPEVVHHETGRRPDVFHFHDFVLDLAIGAGHYQPIAHERNGERRVVGGIAPGPRAVHAAQGLFVLLR